LLQQLVKFIDRYARHVQRFQKAVTLPPFSRDKREQRYADQDQTPRAQMFEHVQQVFYGRAK